MKDEIYILPSRYIRYVFLQMGGNSDLSSALIIKMTQRHVVFGSWSVRINIWILRSYLRFLLLAAESKANFSYVIKGNWKVGLKRISSFSACSFPQCLALEIYLSFRIPLGSTVKAPFYKIKPVKSISEHLWQFMPMSCSKYPKWSCLHYIPC